MTHRYNAHICSRNLHTQYSAANETYEGPETGMLGYWSWGGRGTSLARQDPGWGQWVFVTDGRVEVCWTLAYNEPGWVSLTAVNKTRCFTRKEDRHDVVQHGLDKME